MLKHIKISHKIYILGLTQLLLMLVMGAVALTQMFKIGSELVDIAEKNIPLTSSITKLTSHQLEQNILIERATFNAVLIKQGIAKSKQNFDDLTTQINTLSNTIEQEISNIEAFVQQSINQLNNESTIKEYQGVLSKVKNIKRHTETFFEESGKFLNFVETAPIDEIAQKASLIKANEDKLQHEIVDLLIDIQAFTLKSSLQAEEDEKSGVLWILFALSIAVIVGLTLPLIIARSITKPIKELSARLNEIAQGDGDLTIALNDASKDETGDVARAFNAFLSILRTLLRTTNVQADVLGRSSEVAMKAMTETVSNVEKQRVETEMVATAVNEMSTTTHDVAQNASSAAEITEVVKSKVTKGQTDALDTQNIIKKLSYEVEQASSVIQNLVQETNNIGNVLESIQGIAEQTNLLALNAAIEAARAGETGRGFAVVADEVRTLAQRTQSSTINIQDLLLRLKSEANNAVVSMDKGTEIALACLDKSEQTNKTFEEAAESVLTISDFNIQIAAAAEQQSIVAEEINKNLVNISRMADITAQGANATAEANTTIAKRVIDLHTNLNAFVVD